MILDLKDPAVPGNEAKLVLDGVKLQPHRSGARWHAFGRMVAIPVIVGPWIVAVPSAPASLVVAVQIRACGKLAGERTSVTQTGNPQLPCWSPS